MNGTELVYRHCIEIVLRKLINELIKAVCMLLIWLLFGVQRIPFLAVDEVFSSLSLFFPHNTSIATSF